MTDNVAARLSAELSALLLREIGAGTPIEQVSIALLELGACASFMTGMDEAATLSIMPQVMMLAREQMTAAAQMRDASRH